MADFQTKVTLEGAYRHFEAGNVYNAELDARKVLDEHPGSLKALRLLGLVAATKNDVEAAARIVKKCIAARPNDPTFRWDLARVKGLEKQGTA